MKILIIEDDFFSKFVTAHPFKKNNHVVLEAEDCETGYDIMISEKPDIIIIDNMLPVDAEPNTEPTEQGANLADRIRKTKGFEKIPIILMTSYRVSTTLENMSGTSPIIEYFEKPFNNKRLYKRCKALVESKGKRQDDK